MLNTAPLIVDLHITASAHVTYIGHISCQVRLTLIQLSFYFFQCLYLKAFPSCVHDIYEELMMRSLSGKHYSETDFYLDVVKQEVCLRVFMDVENTSYFEALDQLKAKVHAEHLAEIEARRTLAEISDSESDESAEFIF